MQFDTFLKKIFGGMLLSIFLYSCHNSDTPVLNPPTAPIVENKELNVEYVVLDNIGLLNKEEINVIDTLIRKIYLKKRVQVNCYLFYSYKPYDNEVGYADSILKTLDKKDSSIMLITLFKEDRSIYIRTNQKASLKYSNEMCKEIIDFHMIPYFKEGRIFNGVEAGLKELLKK